MKLTSSNIGKLGIATVIVGLTAIATAGPAAANDRKEPPKVGETCSAYSNAFGMGKDSDCWTIPADSPRSFVVSFENTGEGGAGYHVNNSEGDRVQDGKFGDLGTFKTLELSPGETLRLENPYKKMTNEITVVSTNAR